MGSAASSISADSYDQLRRNEQQQQPPNPTVSLDSTTGLMVPAARNGPSASFEDSDGTPQLVDSTGGLLFGPS
jgi:hypothetical protein